MSEKTNRYPGQSLRGACRALVQSPGTWTWPQQVCEARASAGEWKQTHEESASWVFRFLEHDASGEEEYIEWFELSPQCSLYVGSHGFEEPKTCSEAANCDRNQYMVELVNLYKNFGLTLDSRELPDYLPLMVEFLALTAHAHGDPVRKRLIEEYLLPFMDPIRRRLEELGTPYQYLCRALTGLLKFELEQMEATGGSQQSNETETESVRS